LDEYKKIYKHYENCFETEGDNHKGVDWPNGPDVKTRYLVMTELFIHESHPVVLDFGCGLGHYLDFIKEQKNVPPMKYIGLDISKKFIDVCKQKYPNEDFVQVDVLKENINVVFDYAIMNGVFTVKGDLSFEDMWKFMTFVIKNVYDKSQVGIAFNVMSKNVDWEKSNLFHVSLDELSLFLCKNLSRNFVIRNDYGLYEYTVYVFKQARKG